MKIYIIEQIFDHSCYILKDAIAFRELKKAEDKIRLLNQKHKGGDFRITELILV